MYHDLPQLVCGSWLDTVDFAVAVRTAGIGLSVAHPGRLEAKDISAKLTRLLTEESFRETTALYGAKSRAAGGARAAVYVPQSPSCFLIFTSSTGNYRDVIASILEARRRKPIQVS